MNRRHLAVIAVVIAVPLFAAPLVAPVPDYGPHLNINVENNSMNFSTEESKEKRLRNVTTVRYQQLSGPAQRLFEMGYKNINTDDKHDLPVGTIEPTIQLDEVPEPWATLAPANQRVGYDSAWQLFVTLADWLASNT